MDILKFKDLLFKRAKEYNFKDYEIYYIDKENISISSYEYEVDKYNISSSKGLSFRGIINNKMGYSYTEILNEESIDLLIKNAIESANNIEVNDEEFIYKGDGVYEDVLTYCKELDDIDVSELIEKAIEIEKYTRGYDDRVVNIKECKITYSTQSQYIFNNKGLNLNNKSNILLSYVIPILEYGNEKIDGFSYLKENSIHDINPQVLAKNSIEDAYSKSNSVSLNSKKYKTILNNEAMSSLLQAFWSIFSAEKVQKGLSLINQKDSIASDIVNIVDNPHIDYGFNSTSFDDEGVATLKKYIIKNGKLENTLHNLKTSNKDNIKSTGNGFKSSYSSTISISPTNMYIDKGGNTFEELIEKMNEGLVITELSGLHAGTNSISGDFSLLCKGYYIKHGKRKFNVDQITVSGNFYELLNDIIMIGDDLIFPLSNIGSSSVLIRKLNIAGK